MIQILQIDAGSMGTRRIRDLSCRTDVKLALLEERPDRRAAAAERFGIETFSHWESAFDWGPHALSISTPPDRHDPVIEVALDRGLHHFCEANIWTMNPQRIRERSLPKNLICAPSNSLHFLPAVKELTRIVREELGSLHAYQVALNTYMPDWHPNEGQEYYARNRNTFAGREMVPFELLYLNEVFGSPVEVSGRISRAGSLPEVAEDTWALQMRLNNGATGQLLVLQGCPSQLRAGCAFGERGQLSFDLITGQIETEYRSQGKTSHALGPINTVLEAAYREEIDTFVEALLGNTVWPQTYEASAIATGTLAAMEASSLSRMPVSVDPFIQPAHIN